MSHAAVEVAPSGLAPGRNTSVSGSALFHTAVTPEPEPRVPVDQVVEVDFPTSPTVPPQAIDPMLLTVKWNRRSPLDSSEYHVLVTFSSHWFVLVAPDGVSPTRKAMFAGLLFHTSPTDAPGLMPPVDQLLPAVRSDSRMSVPQAM